jgi:hypothetical protein
MVSTRLRGGASDRNGGRRQQERIGRLFVGTSVAQELLQVGEELLARKGLVDKTEDL